MSTAEQIRSIVTSIADLQKTASWETQVELARAAEILVKEAGRLEGARSAAPMNAALNETIEWERRRAR